MARPLSKPLWIGNAAIVVCHLGFGDKAPKDE